MTLGNCARLLAARCDAIPKDTRQLWVASPYHAKVVRDGAHVMPEGQLVWDEADAQRLCEVLNPLLQEEGMQLLPVGPALLLACREEMEAKPVGFGEISGKPLPNVHHEGGDGGRMNRLLSEIQMQLFQTPDGNRADRGEPEITGIWLWGACHWPEQVHEARLPVATRNPVLRDVVNGRSAELIISEAERLAELLSPRKKLPERILLAGEGKAVVLQRSFWQRRATPSWKPVKPGDELSLMSHVTDLIEQ